MSGTHLVLLAMYATVNVVGPAGAHLRPSLVPPLICLLIGAAILTCWQSYSLSQLPKRPAQTGPKFTPMRRNYTGPGPRRV